VSEASSPEGAAAAGGHRGRCYLILGATGGTGQALARRLHAAGARLTLAARRREALDSLVEELGARGECLDARDFDAVERCLRETLEHDGAVDGIVQCAGSLLLKPPHRTSREEWSDVLETNLGTAFATVRAAGAVLRSAGSSVVLFSSAAATIGLAHHEAIAAAKAGVAGLVRAAAATYASRNLRFNAVAPGMMRTPMTEPFLASAAAEKASVSLHPLRRLGRPAQAASLAAWLLDPEQDWVTGQVLGVDGGLSRLRPLPSA
jgi:NAD(P)-dependent dehydrogenase (short-subunit alcohol dehydrogenase family)